MPSVRKLTLHPSNLLPKAEKDLTVFSSATLSHQTELSDSSMNYSKILVPSVAMELSMEQDTSSDSPTSPPTRKRQRLDHLSQEEKVMRRKMKNRVAAQSARDRKKAKMTELEEQVLQLETQKRYLFLENAELKKKNAKLEEQNAELRLRLSLSNESIQSKVESTEVILPDSNEHRAEEGGSLEYASLISGPLLKEQDLYLLTLWMMRYVYLPTIAKLMIFLICYNSAAIACFSVTSTAQHSVWKQTRSTPLSQNSPKLYKWWGPHQKAWNPSKN